jgi:DNA repair protein RecO (recombination protein O)
MIENASGLVLRVRPLTETSLIVHWFTPELGRVATVAKGARGPKSPFRGKLDLLYLADFSFSRSRRSELHTLREVSLRETHSRLREDLARLRQAAYCTSLIEQTTETEAPLPEVFGLMRDFIRHLVRHEPRPQYVFSLELRLLDQLGLKPDLEQTKLKPGTRELVKVLQGGDWEMMARVKLSDAQTDELRQFLHGFLIYHIERIPKGRAGALGLREESAAQGG